MPQNHWWRQQWHKWRQKVPTHEEIFAKKWLKPLAPYFNQPYFWVASRRKVALAVGIGLFAGLMPGPTQMLTALLLAYVLRAHLPISLATTLYTNPLTYLPLYYLAYQLGFFILEGGNGNMMSFDNWKAVIDVGGDALQDALSQQAQYLLLGVPTLSSFLGVSGYVLVRLLWRCKTVKRWQNRHAHKHHL